MSPSEIENYMDELKSIPIKTETTKRLIAELESLKESDKKGLEPDDSVSEDDLSKGFFKVIKNPDEKLDISCILLRDIDSNIPQNLSDFWDEVSYTNSIIKRLKNTDFIKKDEYIDDLVGLAKVGLEGEFPQPELAKKSLDRLKNEIILYEGGKIKNGYMAKLGWQALAFISITTLLGCMFKFGVFSASAGIKSISSYFFVWSGAMVGTWISFGVRKLEIVFEDLAVIEKDRMKPWLRLLFVGLSSVILLLFINSSFVTLDIGGVNTSAIKSNVELQLFLGVVAGLLEKKLASGLFSKANDALDIDNS